MSGTKTRFLIITSVVVIFMLGLLMVFNTTAAEVLDRSLDRSTHYALLKQLLYAILGLLAAGGVWFVGYQNILKWSGFFLLGGVVLLILVFVPGIGQQINGASRWIGILGNSFQPSEFVKYLIPIYFVHVATSKERALDSKEFYTLIAKVAVPMALILVEPDNGTVAIILMTLIALFFLMKIRFAYWLWPLLILMTLGIGAASQMPHVSDRIRIYLHPEEDLKGKGHQPYQAKIAAGSGQLLGRGIGQSLQKLDYLPEARSDYIAAIYAEECGFVGVLSLVLLFMFFTYLGFHLASSASDAKSFYLIAILTFVISFQAFLNLGIVSGLLPSKGTNLPFFSQGGSSLIANFMAVAMMLQTAKANEQLQKA